MKISQSLLLPFFLAAPAVAQEELAAVQIADGLGLVTDFRMAPGDDSRIFIASSKRGIYVVKDGVVQSEWFLWLDPILNHDSAEGLLSMAFHPDYETNGRFYVCYIDSNHDSYVVEYTVSADPDIADPNSANVILGPVPQPTLVHNFDNLVFGPDGMLYVTTGEGTDHEDTTTNYPQDLSSWYGKVLRIDVDAPPPHVPPDNPFVGVPGVREEVWLYGLRQPWRLTFDSATGDAYIGDVGFASREEVNFIPAGSPGGLNFGWRCMEGSECAMYAPCNPMCGDPSWVDPIYDYPHEASATAVIGGYVYRGAGIPWLQGKYLFGDNREGRFWSFRYDGATLTDFEEHTADLTLPGLNRITCFGQDHDGELYFMNTLGELYRIVDAATLCAVTSYCPTNPNTSGSTALIDNAGSTSIASNDFELLVTGATPGQFGIFYYGPNEIEVPFGDGFRCVGGQTFRLRPPLLVDGGGAGSYLVDFEDPPEPIGTITAGSEWKFQFWYRDPASQTASFNLSDALSVAFCP